jgi:Rrf2 family protein
MRASFPAGREITVNLSARTQYACVAVLELALRHGRGEPVPLRQIADPHGIPTPFLVQILLQLKAAGIVESVRGASGGYRLARPPAELTLGEVVGIIEGTNSLSSSLDDTAASRVLLGVWREADRAQRDCLDATTFAGLLERARGHTETMYYI